MKLYKELASWWPLLSAPSEYEEEAGLYWAAIEKYKERPIATALELGSGGGNNAMYLKQHCQFTLSDLSPSMIEISKRLNPECHHVVADMRYINLNTTFDLVFIHDAIMYMTTEDDLHKVFTTAYQHLTEKGLLFIAPDFFAETFKPDTSHGGHDGQGKGLRYLEWTSDRDPSDHIVETDYVYLLKDEQGRVVVEHDRAIGGVFPKATWTKLLEAVGFKVTLEQINHSELDPGSYFGIVCIKE